MRDANITMRDYQREALRTCPENTNHSAELAILALGVSGEAGEVADLIKKVVGHGHLLDREKVGKEIGDVLWYLAVLSAKVGYTLDEVATMNIEKLRARYPEGFTSERSKNRSE